MNSGERLTEWIKRSNANGDTNPRSDIGELFDIIEDAWDEAILDSDGEAENHEHKDHSVRIVETKQTVDAELADRNGVHQDVVAVMRATEALIPSYATSARYCVRCRKWVDVEFRGHPTSALQDTRIGDDVADGTGGEDQ